MTFIVHAPQIIWIALVAFSLADAVVNHGKPRQPYNIYVDLLGTAITIALLWWGGFFGGAR